MKRVVVTGLGMVSPIGSNVDYSWQAAVDGKSGVARITLFDAEDFPVKIAAEVKSCDMSVIMPAKEARRSTRFVNFALKAASEAIEYSGLAEVINRHRIGVSIGVGLGGLQDIEVNSKILADHGPKKISPFFMPYTIANMAAGRVSIKYGFGGPNTCPTTACASGTHGIGEGFLLIRNGLADAMVCGGAEATISPLGIAAFTALKALSSRNQDPSSASRPFDRNRDGFVMGEGAGILILEELEFAKARDANILAEIVGFGMSGDGFHITAPLAKAEGGQRCMKMALGMAKANVDEVDYINAHGTSTKLNDLYESQAIQEIFGSHSQKISISSTKSVTGHCIGAAGGIEAVFTVKSLMHNLVPPTINCKETDIPGGLDYTPQQARQKKVHCALSNSFGFGGTNASIVLRSFPA